MISFLYLKRPTFYTRDFKEIEISRKISNNHNPQHMYKVSSFLTHLKVHWFQLWTPIGVKI